jgi:hypothetical protein
VVYAVGFMAHFEAFNLSNYVRSVVSHSNEASANAFLVVGVLDPPDQFSSADANLKKIFQLDLLFNQLKALFLIFLLIQKPFAVLSFTLVVTI